MWSLLSVLAACVPHPVEPVPMGAPGSPALAEVMIRDGAPSQRQARDDGADLAILYGGEQDGEPGLCGCDVRPRGGIDRFEAYADRVQVPTLRVNVGRWLTPGMADVDGNAAVVDALSAGDWDVLNVTPAEVFVLRASDRWPATAMSTNLEGPVALPTQVRRETDAGPVVVFGLTGDGRMPTGWTAADPVEALQSALASLTDDPLVVVVGHGLDRRFKEIAQTPGVDVLIAGDGYGQANRALTLGPTVWVRSEYQTVQLGELRLRIDEGAVLGAVDRKVDLDRGMPRAPEIRGLRLPP